MEMGAGRLVAEFGVERAVADQAVGVSAKQRVPERYARTQCGEGCARACGGVEPIV
jgi:hypothetical protein